MTPVFCFSQRHSLSDDRSAKVARTQLRSQRRYWLENIGTDWMLEGELLVLTFATGIQDSTTYSDYGCFASNQTGNTILVAVGLAGQRNSSVLDIRNIGVSLCLFIAGGLLSGQLGNILGVRRRLWLLLSNLYQTILVFAATGIQYRYGVEKSGSRSIGTLALLAFASGAQVAVARSVMIPEITTAMVTSAYMDLLIDPSILSIHNRPRNRRFLFVFALIGGSFAGAFAPARIGSASTLLVSGIGKLIVTLAFFFNKTSHAPLDPGLETDLGTADVLQEV